MSLLGYSMAARRPVRMHASTTSTGNIVWNTNTARTKFAENVRLAELTTLEVQLVAHMNCSCSSLGTICWTLLFHIVIEEPFILLFHAYLILAITSSRKYGSTFSIRSVTLYGNGQECMYTLVVFTCVTDEAVSLRIVQFSYSLLTQYSSAND
eukprot:scpid56989/ scgid18161/ 